MKKFAFVVAAALLGTFAPPALLLANSFADVPANHWAYDALARLAAHGILSGYPSGAGKGGRLLTRYEMASALSRALAVADATKTAAEDVRTLKRLGVELRDELSALGVKIGSLEEPAALMEDRLGDWRIHGSLCLDAERHDSDAITAPRPEGNVELFRARLFFERRFGEGLHFTARLDKNRGDSLDWRRFFVTVPFYGKSTLTIGRFAEMRLEEDYYLGMGKTYYRNTGGFIDLNPWFSKAEKDGICWRKNFGLGSVTAYAAHPRLGDFMDTEGFSTPTAGSNDAERPDNWSAWEVLAMGRFQFTERFGFDMGGQAFFGDNTERSALSRTKDDTRFNSLWTLFAGLHLDLGDAVALKGFYAHQQLDTDRWSGSEWADVDHDGTQAWKIIVDVKRKLFKFTGLWLEYGRMDRGFVVPRGIAGNMGSGGVFSAVTSRGLPSRYRLWDDLRFWRVALGQEWNAKWSSHLFCYGYDFDKGLAGGGDLLEYGLGVQYLYGSGVKFGLNYARIDWDRENGRFQDENIIRLRTEVTF